MNTFKIIVVGLLLFSMGCNKQQDNTTDRYNSDSFRIIDSIATAERLNTIMKVVDEKAGISDTNTEDDIANSWVGKYEFIETWKEIGGKSTAGVGYAINVEKRGDNVLAAKIKMDGFQTSNRFICNVEYSNNQIAFYLQRFGKGNSSNIYKIGDNLLALEKNGNKLITHWKKLTPILDKNLKNKNAFKRINN